MQQQCKTLYVNKEFRKGRRTVQTEEPCSRVFVFRQSHVTRSACPCDCSSAVPHGKCALLFRLKQLLGSHRVAASRDCCPCGWSTCQAQMAADSFSTPGQGVLTELTEEPVPAMAKASSVSDSDQRDESAEDGARA